MAAAIGIAVVIVFLALLGLGTGGAAREGVYRRGPGWYLDTETPRDTLMKGRFGLPSRRRISRRVIWLWVVAGVGFLIAGIVSWSAVGSVPVAILCAVIGFLTLGMAGADARQNRLLGEQPNDNST